MKKLVFAGALCLSISFTACDSTTTDETTTTDSLHSTLPTSTPSDRVMNDTSMSGVLSDDDRKFAEKAARGGLMEVALGKLAQERATHADVKAFGQRMVTDHTKANEELMALLKRKNISIDASYHNDQQKMIDKLTDKTGSDFDKDYVDAMVKDHKDDVDDFKDAVDDLKDTDLKNWARTTLPVLESHLQEIQRIKDAMK